MKLRLIAQTKGGAGEYFKANSSGNRRGFDIWPGGSTNCKRSSPSLGRRHGGEYVLMVCWMLRAMSNTCLNDFVHLVWGREFGYAETPMTVVAMTLNNHGDGRAAQRSRRVCGEEWYHKRS